VFWLHRFCPPLEYGTGKYKYLLLFLASTIISLSTRSRYLPMIATCRFDSLLQELGQRFTACGFAHLITQILDAFRSASCSFHSTRDSLCTLLLQQRPLIRIRPIRCIQNKFKTASTF
jgi:hypothetical protein